MGKDGSPLLSMRWRGEGREGGTLLRELDSNQIDSDQTSQPQKVIPSSIAIQTKYSKHQHWEFVHICGLDSLQTLSALTPTTQAPDLLTRPLSNIAPLALIDNS